MESVWAPDCLPRIYSLVISYLPSPGRCGEILSAFTTSSSSSSSSHPQKRSQSVSPQHLRTTPKHQRKMEASIPDNKKGESGCQSQSQSQSQSACSRSSSPESDAESTKSDVELPPAVHQFFQSVSPAGFPTTKGPKKAQPWKSRWNGPQEPKDGQLIVACPRICTYGSGNLGGY